MPDIAHALDRIRDDVRRRAVELLHAASSLDRIKAGWSALWPYLEYRDLRVLPLMLEKCPDLAGRIELWSCLATEFGVVRSETSRVAELRLLLKRLGVGGRTDMLQNTVGEVEVPASWAGYEEWSFVEVLGGALHAHYIASGELFETLAQQLAQHGIGSKDPALAYLHRGADVATQGLDNARRLADRYITTPADQERWQAQVVHHLRSWQVLS